MINLYTRYSPRANPPDSNYPLGSIKNESVPGADDGTPLEKDWGNNIEGFHQALLAEASITASGVPDKVGASQLLDAIKVISSSSSIANYASLKAYSGNSTKLSVGGRVNYFDGAYGYFVLDASDTTSPDNNGTVLVGVGGKRWKRQFSKNVNPAWFGAVGDATGVTPAGTGEDITSATWNAWPSFITGATYLTQPGHDWGDAAYLAANKPFKNTDTWDFIGNQLAAWTGLHAKTNKGTFVLNQPIRYTNDMRGGMSADCMYSSLFSFKDQATHPVIRGAKCLFDLYRVGGTPSVFNNVSVVGVSGYTAAANPNFNGRLVGVLQTNTNGVHFTNCWIAGGIDMGFDLADNTGDCFFVGNTFEFCGASFGVGAGCDITITDCNMWQSYAAYVPCSIVCGTGTGARVTIDGSRGIGYSGVLFSGTKSKVSWVGGRIDMLAGGVISLSEGCSIMDTDITLQPSTTTAIQLLSKSNLIGNNISGASLTHAIINIGLGFANDTSLVKVSSNTMDITGTFAEGGLLITSIVNGVGYTGAATKCLFSNNVIYNQASAAIGLSGTNTIATNQFGV